MAPVFTFAVLQGLAIDHIVWPPEDRRHDLTMQALKALATMFVRPLDQRSSPPPAATPAAEPPPNVGSG